MNKTDLIKHIAEQSGVSIRGCKDVVDTLFESIPYLLSQDTLTIRDFGKFDCQLLNPGQYNVTFTASAKLEKSLAKIMSSS